MQCALASSRKFSNDAATTQTIAVICRALDGLPLGIELAASRAHTLSTTQIAEQLAQPLSIGAHAIRDLPDRQQTLQATIRWNYDLLTPEAQAVLCGASVFLGGFTVASLQAVTGAAARSRIDELLEANLIRRQPDERRLELLELVRAFALNELESRGLAPEVRARHRRHFGQLVTPGVDAFDGVGRVAELSAPLLADHANLRAALEDALDTSDQPTALTLGLGLRPVWVAGMLRQESQDLVNRLLNRFALPGGQEIKLLRAVAAIDYGPGADIWQRRLASRAAEIGDDEALAMATSNLFARALNTRDRDEMQRLRPELLALISGNASDKALGWIHYQLALDAYVNGRFESACGHATVSIEKAEAIGHDFLLGGAAGARLLAQSARDGLITHEALADALELMGRPGIAPLAAFALWFIARYAAAVAPGAAGRWLAHADRILAPLNSELWPESDLRDEALAVLGLDGVDLLLDSTEPLDHMAAVAEASSWLAQRDPNGAAPRPTAVVERSPSPRSQAARAQTAPPASVPPGL